MKSRRSCPVRDRIMRRYDKELLGAPLWCTTQQEEGLWIQGVNAMVPQRWVFVCASELALDESLSMIGAAGELDCFSAHIRLREPGKSEDKAECMAMDNKAMGLAAPWYRKGRTSVESSILCSHRGRALTSRFLRSFLHNVCPLNLLPRLVVTSNTTYCLLRSLVEHSCINPKSLTFRYLDEKPIDIGLMKFLGLCPSALSWYLEFAFVFSTSLAPFYDECSSSMRARDL
ncbi:hypothetical protein GW17_00059121 [Ensete ventricosum]|nr:hypothetical protein GW17_00059121 [Ensete ventricosum]